jgi:peptidylprolyl isomerase
VSLARSIAGCVLASLVACDRTDTAPTEPPTPTPSPVAEPGPTTEPPPEEVAARPEISEPKTLPIAAPPADAIRTASGLAYVYVRRGTGTTKPTLSSHVTAHYTGWLTDGTKFDSSRDRGEPIDFGLDQVIKGWTEAIQLMVVGDEIRVWIPVELAYQNKPGRPAGMLIFDIELLDVK